MRASLRPLLPDPTDTVSPHCRHRTGRSPAQRSLADELAPPPEPVCVFASPQHSAHFPQAIAPSLADELTPKTEPQGVVERQRLIELLAQLRSQSAELAQTLQVNGVSPATSPRRHCYVTANSLRAHRERTAARQEDPRPAATAGGGCEPTDQAGRRVRASPALCFPSLRLTPRPIGTWNRR